MGYTNYTPDEWREKMSNCTDKSELEYLLRNKPKGANAITTGTPVIVNGATGLPLLEKLSQGKAKELPSLSEQMKKK
jgi:hypothetical protein